MLKELEEFLKPQEERVKFGSLTVVVRELATLEDFTALGSSGADGVYLGLVRCVFTEKGEPVFAEADLPKLKASSKVKLLPLMQAMNRVNGLDIEGEVKNSEAAPG